MREKGHIPTGRRLERLSELNILLNMDDKGSPEAIALDEDVGEEKPSVLGKLKVAKERISESQKDGTKAVKGEEQEL